MMIESIVKINEKKFKALCDFVTKIKDDIANEDYDDFMFKRNYADAWEIVEEITDKILDVPEESICETAPYPECNGANGCDTCKHQPED